MTTTPASKGVLGECKLSIGTETFSCGGQLDGLVDAITGTLLGSCVNEVNKKFSLVQGVPLFREAR